MSGAEDAVQLPVDGSGKKQREIRSTVGGQDVYQDVVTIADAITTSQVLAVDSSGKIGVSALPNVTVNDLLRSLTDPATSKKVNEIDFSWNADGTPATAVYKDAGGSTLFTLTFNYSSGNLTNIIRS